MTQEREHPYLDAATPKTTESGCGQPLTIFGREFQDGYQETERANTFEPLWDKVSAWNCYFYVTDGQPVYPLFIPDGYSPNYQQDLYYTPEKGKIRG